MVVWQHKDQQRNQTEKIDLPVHPSCTFRETRNDLEEHKLQEVERKGEDHTEQDLDEGALLLVLFVELSVEEPKATPCEASKGCRYHHYLEDKKRHRHIRATLSPTTHELKFSHITTTS